MTIGAPRIKTLKVGGIDVLSGDKAGFAGFNIYEDIFNPYGPTAEIRVIDHSDALGSTNLNGSYDQDVEIELEPGEGLSLGGQSKYKLKMYHNKDLNDHSIHNLGSGHHKQYDVRCVAKELLNAQGNYMQKSYNDLTSNMVEDVLKNGFKTDKQIEKKATKGKRRIILHNKHPLDALDMLNHEHVSADKESSVYVVFQQPDSNDHKYLFTTFEHLFEGQTVATLKQSSTLSYENSSESDKQNSIMWFKPGDNFFTPTRPMSKGSEHTFNLTTHKVAAVKPKEYQFTYADKQPVYSGQPSYANTVPIHYVHDKVNNKDKHETSEAKVKRSAFLSHLAQNSAEMEVYYNPAIKVGSMIQIEVPNKSTESDGGEKQFNGKCLIVSVRTKYRTIKEPPYCTMVLRVVKASYKEGGGGGV